MSTTASAKTRTVRIPPRKARLAADVVRGMQAEHAVLQLGVSQLKGGKILKKTLESAIANAELRLNAQRRDLYVKEVRIDAGPVLKRAKPRSKGSRVPVMKRTSHFTVVLAVKG
jgi:large subunit ribosomal protein L22